MPERDALSVHGSYLLPHVNHATVADAMHPGILSSDGEATLTEIARMMSTHHVHCIAVRGAVDDAGDVPPVTGIISDLDLLRAGLRPDGPDSAAALVQQSVVSVHTTAPLRDAAALMLENGTSHAVAVNPDTRRPVGILSTLDIAGVLAWGEM